MLRLWGGASRVVEIENIGIIVKKDPFVCGQNKKKQPNWAPY